MELGQPTSDLSHVPGMFHQSQQISVPFVLEVSFFGRLMTQFSVTLHQAMHELLGFFCTDSQSQAFALSTELHFDEAEGVAPVCSIVNLRLSQLASHNL